MLISLTAERNGINCVHLYISFNNMAYRQSICYDLNE